ncbi:GNAT family N-acetyltransferase [Planococcus lenghuensis]|uniref:GNAT family N-acetyltransferase n=1 Tax=Planococcus lenghuensis TaxID=2213202 RepID=A0A1Q2L1S8_9BACL|nr:GNAT family N-acetyltransferase [Planococcus lenghuensis]AQQ54324.1 GNAT family N-acetyltransferase [Planococcus lenghuensis]
MLIRKAHETEYDEIRRGRIHAYEQYMEQLPEAHWYALKGTLSSGSELHAGAELFIAEAAGDIAGSAVLFPSQKAAYEWETGSLDYPELRMLAVNPLFRNQGVGKSLVLHCIQEAKEAGHSFIGLHTGEFMTDAIGLYERLGFERVPELDFSPLDDGITVKAFRREI